MKINYKFHSVTSFGLFYTNKERAFVHYYKGVTGKTPMFVLVTPPRVIIRDTNMVITKQDTLLTYKWVGGLPFRPNLLNDPCGII